MEVKIENGMHQVGRDRAERADRKREVVAQETRGDRGPARPQFLKSPAAPRQMRAEEKEEARAADRAVFREELEVIVMHLDRVELDPLGPKFPAVVKIGPAPGPERGL